MFRITKDYINRSLFGTKVKCESCGTENIIVKKDNDLIYVCNESCYGKLISRKEGE